MFYLSTFGLSRIHQSKVITQGVNHALIPRSFLSLLCMSFHHRLPTGQAAKIQCCRYVIPRAPCDEPRSIPLVLGRTTGRSVVCHSDDGMTCKANLRRTTQKQGAWRVMYPCVITRVIVRNCDKLPESFL